MVALFPGATESWAGPGNEATQVDNYSQDQVEKKKCCLCSLVHMCKVIVLLSVPGLIHSLFSHVTNSVCHVTNSVCHVTNSVSRIY